MQPDKYSISVLKLQHKTLCFSVHLVHLNIHNLPEQTSRWFQGFFQSQAEATLSHLSLVLPQFVGVLLLNRHTVLVLSMTCQDKKSVYCKLHLTPSQIPSAAWTALHLQSLKIDFLIGSWGDGGSTSGWNPQHLFMNLFLTYGCLYLICSNMTHKEVCWMSNKRCVCIQVGLTEFKTKNWHCWVVW